MLLQPRRRPALAARKRTVPSGPRGLRPNGRDFRLPKSALERLQEAIDKLQGSLAPRSDSSGSSPFLPALSPWLEWDRDSKAWGEADDVDPNQWKELAETISVIFGEFKDAEQSRRCALAGPYGMRLIGTIMRSFVRVVPVHSEGKYHSICEGLIDLIHTQIASQTRAQGSFHSLLPTEVLKIIIGFVYIHETSRVDLALVHPVWRDIALPLLWNSIFVEFDHDAEVKFFAQVARRTSYITRRLYIHAGETRNKVISVDRAIMALKGLRKLTAVTSTMSMSVFASPSMAELSDLTLHLVEVSDAISTTAIPFHLRSLEITGKHYDEDAIDSLLTAIANGSSTTLERLSLDSPQAAQKHLAAFSRNLVELSLTGLSKFNPSELDLPLLRKLTLPRSELHTLLALPPADAPPDALRSTISQTIPHLENLTVSYSGYQMGHEDLLNLDRLLRLPLCNALRALTLEEAEFDEDLNQSGLEVFRKMVVYCEERGVVVKVNGESLC